MTVLPEGIAGLVDELIRLLDDEIHLLEHRCVQLAALSQATLQRDDERLEGLLDEIEQAQHTQAQTDLRLQALRSALAEFFDWPVAQMRLSRLIEELSGDRRPKLAYRREQILLLSERLKRQHLETTLVVAECARINRLLLESLFPELRNDTTYGGHGESSWDPDVRLVDVET